MALKYGGKTISDYSAMRGPCDEGWHIPLKEEWSAVHDIWIALGGGANDGTNFGAVLKMPFTGYRANLTSNVTGQNSYGHYWSSTAHTSSSQAYSFILYPGTIYRASTNVRCYGESIRPFKDEPVIPDSSWTTLYTSDIYPAARNIKWSSSLGLITITYEGTYVTIADKNLGATQVRNSGDTLSEANCGKYYQRGNNYGFAWTGTLANTSTTQVDASTYGPGNYYSSNTFIKYSGARDSSDNRNLRGRVTGVQQKPTDIVERYYGGKLIDDYSAMRGPCPEGFHVPLQSEWQGLKTIMDGLSLTTGSDWKINLHLPFAGRRIVSASTNNQGVYAYYWSSSPYGSAYPYNASGLLISSSISTNHSSNRSEGRSVRCFNNSFIAPTSSWTVITGTLGGAGIFRNQTEGLISITSDGTTGYTIQDKNLGATTVYNDGDTLSEANCGKYYQWGNNYGFLRTGDITTSSTQVNASAYGPGNYYSSSTFITGSTDRSSVHNDNLWGGVTGIQQRIAEVKEVYYNTTKIWPFYPAGIYWSPDIDGGVISFSSNGTDWLTMADKNLGATQVFHPGNSYSQANCGTFFQRGNNYGFSYTGTPSRSTTKVDVSSYGPGNYYSNSTFRRVNGNGDWWTSNNFNLWGGVTGTNEARRGPCPEGWHIPRKSELLTVRSITGYGSLEGKILMPLCGVRDNYSAAVTDAGSLSAIWCSDLEASSLGNYTTSTALEGTGGVAGYIPARGCNIRPFRNEPVIPTDEWTKLL